MKTLLFLLLCVTVFLWWCSSNKKNVTREIVIETCNFQKEKTINDLIQKNNILTESYRTIEKKLKIDSLCWDLWCWKIVRYLWWWAIYSGRIVLYSDEEIKEWIKWQYWIQSEEHWSSNEYIWFDAILPPTEIYKSKKELIYAIKWI